MAGESDERPWVDGLTVSQVLRQTANRCGSRDALVFPHLPLRWTWDELDRRVDRVASGMLRLGVRPGEKVGIWSMNTPEWVVVQFACARIGAVLVNINPAYRLHELEQALLLADVSTIVVGCAFKSSNYAEMIEEIREGGSGTSRLPLLRSRIAIDNIPRPGWIRWDDVESSPVDPGLPEYERMQSPSDVHNIQFTSGTTGLPKGAMLTHRNVLMNAFYVGQRVRYTEDDRVCVPVPFYHCFGCVLGTMVCAVYGSAIVVPAPTFDPRATLAAIEMERCTALYGVPTMFISQVDHPDRSQFDLSSLRTGIIAGSPCPLPLMQAVVCEMGAKEITIGYGQTEASPIITMTSADDPIEVRVGTVGRPLPGVEVKVVDTITGRELDDGLPGELCARGHVVMAGYYKNEEATRRAIDADGWLATGDLARRRPDGNYRIVGRSKEMIIRGGENIYPAEVEEFLHQHPGVAEVAIFGLPDLRFGEVIAAWVVPKPGVSLTADVLRAFCQGQIAHYKIPQYLEIVEHLPKTVTGKVRKHLLREDGINRYSLQDAAEINTA